MCDRLFRKGLIRRHRARADRREVQVSVTAAGRAVVDQATARRRELLAEILGRLPARRQAAVAAALQEFAAAAGEVPDSHWPHQAAGPDGAGSPEIASRTRRAVWAASSAKAGTVEQA
jgi:hypothetical protein